MKFRLLLFLFFCTYSLLGQDYSYKAFTVRDKFNTNLISGKPYVDRNGFAWYAVNSEGVFYKYDGRNNIRFSFFKTKRKYSDISSVVHSWIEDDNGNIWAINPNGAYIINSESFKMKYIHWGVDILLKKLSFKPNTSIVAIKDDGGNILISLGRSYILKFDKNYNKTLLTNSNLKKKEANQFESGVFDLKSSLKIVKKLEDGRILAHTDADIYIIDKKGIHLFSSIKALDKDIKSYFYFVDNGNLFKKNSSGYYRYNNIDYRYIYVKELNLHLYNYPYGNLIHTHLKIFTADENKILISTFNKEKNILKTIDTIKLKKSILYNSLKLYSKSTLSFSTFDNIYLLKTNDLRFKKYLQLDNTQISVRGLVSDKKNNLFVGSYHHGIIKINTTNKSFVKKPPDPSYNFNYFSSLLIDKDSILWALSEDNFIKSINLLNNKEINVRYITNSRFRPIFIKEKSEDSLWVGTDVGLYVFDKKSGSVTNYGQANKMGLGICEDVIETYNGDIWIASQQGLFYQKKGERGIEYSKKNKFFQNEPVSVLYEDNNNNLWIGTTNEGVVCLDPKTGKMQVYSHTNGLSNNTVCGILESKNEMWFSTYFGLSALNKKTKKFNNFYKEDGLPDNEFNKWSYYKKNDSVFYFGGLNGIVEFNPLKLKHNLKKSKIFLSKSEFFCKISNKDVIRYTAINDLISLPYSKNFFSAEFTLSDIYDNDKSTFYYKIEGLTDGWVSFGSSGLLKLYGLPAGNHTITVKGKDFEGFETVNEIKIPIHVERLFFKTPAFIVLMILLIILFIWQQFKRKIRKQKNIFRREKEIIALKANALKAQMNPHFVFNIMNNMQSIMILKGEEEANKYFGAFSRLLRITLDMSKQELVTLKNELDYISYYLVLSNLQLNNELDFTITIDDSVGNSEQIFLPGMLVQPFVENAIIHGLTPIEGEKKININCFIDKDYLIIVIEDNGIGRELSSKYKANKQFDYKSWSTTIVNERIDLINATNNGHILLSIEDIVNNNINNGTKVILKFKVR